MQNFFQVQKSAKHFSLISLIISSSYFLQLLSPIKIPSDMELNINSNTAAKTSPVIAKTAKHNTVSNFNMLFQIFIYNHLLLWYAFQTRGGYELLLPETDVIRVNCRQWQLPQLRFRARQVTSWLPETQGFHWSFFQAILPLLLVLSLSTPVSSTFSGFQ